MKKEHNEENTMRVDEMCGACQDEMEAPKTNYNLTITTDKDDTHTTTTVSSDKPEELMRMLQLSGMPTAHAEPDGDEGMGMDHSYEKPSSISSMKDLIAKVSKPALPKEEAIEVEQDPTNDAKVFGLKDLVIGQSKKQPKQRTVSARHGDNPYKDAGQLEEEFTSAYNEFKSQE